MKTIKSICLSAFAVATLVSCTPNKKQEADAKQPDTSVIVRLDPAIDQLIAQDASLEVLGEGYTWAEGPVWVPSHQMLLFTDVPNNIIYKWKEGEGVTVFLTPSGYTGEKGQEQREPGANGLTLDRDGKLLLCQHGDRRLARLSASFENPLPEFETLIGNYEGKRFNSPNDLAMKGNGDLYFTDPPYGLTGLDDSPIKEIPFNGVYLLKSTGELILLTSELSKPNGIALSPDEKTLYVANSDPARPVWMSFPVLDDGTVGEGSLFFDATDLNAENPGNPDGMKIDSQGNIFATGPGGVLVISSEGKHLGTILTGAPTANIAFGETEKVVFITSQSRLLRMTLRD